MISDAESIIMQSLWRLAPQTAEQIIGEVAGPQGWNMRTVKTLLGRLLAKGAVSAEPDGRRYLYSPVLTREAYMANQSDELVDRLYGGRLAPLMLHFSEREKLDAQDIEDIRKLLERIDRRHGK